MRDVRDLQMLQIDALKEVGNIGGGHAATALSQLVGRKTMVKVPSVYVIPLEEISGLVGPSEDTVGVGILMHLLGDVTGKIVIIFRKEDATLLASLMLGSSISEIATLGEVEQSALRELGNILTGAYLSALGDFMGLILLPSVPMMTIDMLGVILNSICLEFGDVKEHVICIETEFEFLDEANTVVQGYFFLLPPMESLQTMLEAIQMC